MALQSEDPRRVDVFRHFAQIYGRFDAKRRPDKVLTQHERVVNEAAAQVALFRPELLTRRDELFPLARKVWGTRDLKEYLLFKLFVHFYF